MSLPLEKLLEIEKRVATGVISLLVTRRAFKEVPVEMIVGPMSEFDAIAQIVGCDLDRLYGTARDQLSEVIDTSHFPDDVKKKILADLGDMIDRLRPERREEASVVLAKFKSASDRFDQAVAKVQNGKAD